jgi:hypothetical protein
MPLESVRTEHAFPLPQGEREENVPPRLIQLATRNSAMPATDWPFGRDGTSSVSSE